VWRNQSSCHRLLQLPEQCQAVKTLAVHWHCDVCSVSGGIQQSVESPSLSAALCHVVTSDVLQYVAASFHLPSVSTLHTNTVQHTKPYSNMKHHQSQLFWHPNTLCFLSPTSRQPLFIPTAGYCLVSLHVCQNTKAIITKTQFLFSTQTSHRTPQIPTQNVQLPTYCSTFQTLNAPYKAVITLFHWATNYEVRIVAAWNLRCRYVFVYKMIYMVIWQECSSVFTDGSVITLR